MERLKRCESYQNKINYLAETLYCKDILFFDFWQYLQKLLKI